MATRKREREAKSERKKERESEQCEYCQPKRISFDDVHSFLSSYWSRTKVTIYAICMLVSHAFIYLHGNVAHMNASVCVCALCSAFARSRPHTWDSWPELYAVLWAIWCISMLFVLFSLFFHSTEEKKGHVAIHSTYLTMYDSNIANAAFKYLSSFVRFRIIFMCVWLLSQGELTVPKCETFHILHSALCRTACINLKHWNSASSPFSIWTIKYTFLLPKHHEWRDGDRINISSGDKRAHCTLH